MLECQNPYLKTAGICPKRTRVCQRTRKFVTASITWTSALRLVPKYPVRNSYAVIIQPSLYWHTALPRWFLKEDHGFNSEAGSSLTSCYELRIFLVISR